MAKQIKKVLEKPILFIIIMGIIMVVYIGNTTLEMRKARNQIDLIQEQMEELQDVITNMETRQEETVSNIYTEIENMNQDIEEISKCMDNIVIRLAIPYPYEEKE